MEYSKTQYMVRYCTIEGILKACLLEATDLSDATTLAYQSIRDCYKILVVNRI